MDPSDSNISGESHFRQEFSRLIGRPEEDLDLGRAALILAGEEYPDLDLEQSLSMLDRMAEAAGELMGAHALPAQRAEVLGRYLFQELGFHGNSDDYYNPENSYFNRVLERRTGIPITLCLLFIEVGRRIGLRCHGVGMPGHFLVGLEGDDIYFDPFNGSGPLNSTGCRQIAQRLFGERLDWQDSYLTPCTKYEFLYRILNNLKIVYERTDALDKALRVVELMSKVRPDLTSTYLELAALQFRQQMYRSAISSLEAYLREAGDASDASQVRAWIESIRVTLSRLN